MPTIPIYVRKDDYQKFLEVYSPEWLHNALNGAVPQLVRGPRYKVNDPGEEVAGSIPASPAKIVEPRAPELRIDATKGTAVATAIPKSDRFDGPLCKIHNLPLDGRGKCLQKGCKYS